MNNLKGNGRRTSPKWVVIFKWQLAGLFVDTSRVPRISFSKFILKIALKTFKFRYLFHVKKIRKVSTTNLAKKSVENKINNKKFSDIIFYKVLRRAFSMFDSSKTGKIEKEKVRTILNTLGHTYDDSDLDALLESEDTEGQLTHRSITKFSSSFTNVFLFINYISQGTFHS